MKTAVLTESGFEIREGEIPGFPDNEILIKILGFGVCGRDVFVCQNRARMASTHSIMSHESCGEIIAIGSKVEGFAVGDFVTTFSLPAYGNYLCATPEHALGEPIACCIHTLDRIINHPGDGVAVIGCGFMGLIIAVISVES